ncbi:phage virion morphogenesis protein [Kosakonia cowanii]|nr:phage virion morphogenesis protein [Kosakonia cowanii]
MSNDLFRDLDATFSAILSATSPSGRLKISRIIGRKLRSSQRQRIRSQKGPDGAAYMQRKRRILHTNREVKFLWNGQIRTLKNWFHGKGKYGKTITGIDADRRDFRTFYRSDIERWLEISSVSASRTTKKYTPMFSKLRTYRFLKMRADAGGTSVGYDGVAARIARVHQYGQRDQAGPGAFAKYPVRELLGFTAGDEQMITEQVINSLGSAAR